MDWHSVAVVFMVSLVASSVTDSFEFKQLRFNRYSNCNISQDSLAGKHLFTSGLSHCVNPRGAVNLRAAAQVR